MIEVLGSLIVTTLTVEKALELEFPGAQSLLWYEPYTVSKTTLQV